MFQHCCSFPNICYLILLYVSIYLPLLSSSYS
uniref:Uncharacterized protein n=1 Tax=Siphoviridae sp. ctOOe6 TaxID=2826309 RepID=A0A8S5LY12_9CAUD|nr:MAG TPA: hypothetical protein [Siphoviridae sp. ctOOe6]